MNMNMYYVYSLTCLPTLNPCWLILIQEGLHLRKVKMKDSCLSVCQVHRGIGSVLLV